MITSQWTTFSAI